MVLNSKTVVLKKRVLIFLCVFLFSINAYTQDFLTDPTIIKYFPGVNEPELSWKNIDFNDDSWLTGAGIIGYGDTCDTNIETVPSIYTRAYFNIENPSSLKELTLLMDFDDGFVAYINGVECARVNMGPFGSNTTFNQKSDRSHEMVLYRELNYPVLSYYIDKNFIDAHIKSGTNVLSIEVHNDSILGSDLGILGVLVNRTYANYNIFDLFSRYKKCAQLDSTELPILIIESDEYGIPYKRIEVPATISIIDNGIGNFNKPGDNPNGHSGAIDIEVRGESSSTFPKRSYDIELHDVDGKDTSVSLLGLPRESDWILQGTFADKSQIRNAIIYELGRKTGHWAPNVKFCELILNGEYLGLYNIIEKIKRDSNRVNVGKLTETEISGTDLTGGYILKYDKPGGLQIAYPKQKNLQPEQEQYILNFINEYKTVLNSDNGFDDELGYSKYIDENSLIDYTIISEFAKNCDAYLYSSYLFKDKDDRDGRIKFGPLWDFDLCFGNSIWQEGFKTEGWQFEYPLNNEFDILRLFEDPKMARKFRDRWLELRKGFLHTDSVFAMIDALTAELANPLKRNYDVWPVIDKGVFFPAYEVSNYEEEINTIKDWIEIRSIWLDNNINDQVSSINNTAIYNEKFEASVFPNPFTTEFCVDLTMPYSGNLKIELINIRGKLINVIENTYIKEGNYKVYWNNANTNITPGLHLVTISINGVSYRHLKVISIKK